MSQQLVVRYLSSDQDVNPGRSYSESAPVLTQSWSLKHPVSPGVVGQARRLSADGVTLEWFTPATNIAGSSVGAYLVYAGPSTPGYPENPSFIALTPGYIPDLPASQITSGVFDISLLPVGTNANSVAAGNDVRFHTQNTDLGTNSQTFKIGIGGTELTLKATATGFEFRNAADTDYADFRAGNVITGNQVEIGDNKIVLNSDVVGVPTEDGGISLNRGSSIAAEVVWSEADKEWQAGTVGSMASLTRHRIFTVTQAQANVGSGHVIVHNLGTYIQPPTCYFADGSSFIPASYTVALNQVTIDFASIQFNGVITVRIDG